MWWAWTWEVQLLGLLNPCSHFLCFMHCYKIQQIIRLIKSRIHDLVENFLKIYCGFGYTPQDSVIPASYYSLQSKEMTKKIIVRVRNMLVIDQGNDWSCIGTPKQVCDWLFCKLLKPLNKYVIGFFVNLVMHWLSELITHATWWSFIINSRSWLGFWIYWIHIRFVFNHNSLLAPWESFNRTLLATFVRALLSGRLWFLINPEFFLCWIYVCVFNLILFEFSNNSLLCKICFSLKVGYIRHF